MVDRNSVDSGYVESLRLPVCGECKHWHGNATCDAFPEKIPKEIFQLGNPHRKPYPGDHGIRFEPK